MAAALRIGRDFHCVLCKLSAKSGPKNGRSSCGISATDWKEGGWDLPQSIELCRRFKGLGVDLVDVSSGGLVPNVTNSPGPGYQVKFAAAIRSEAHIATGSVGMLTDPAQVETILTTEQADLVFLARNCCAILTGPVAPHRNSARNSNPRFNTNAPGKARYADTC